MVTNSNKELFYRVKLDLFDEGSNHPSYICEDPMKLFPHQEESLSKIKNGNIVVGGVGSGKSILTIAYYWTKILGGDLHNLSKPIKNSTKLYIITTAMKRNLKEWDKELLKFYLDVEHSEANPNKIEIVIDSWNNVKKYKEVKDAFFIFDEDKVTGYGVWAKSFITISKHNQWVIATATPGDKWEDYIPVFIANGFFRNKTHFMEEHCLMSRFSTYPKIEKYLKTVKLAEYRDAITVTVNYKPPAELHHIYERVGYDKSEYMKVMKFRVNPFTSEPIKNISELCFTVRKINNSDNSRIFRLKRLVMEHPKVIIFYNYNYELDILKEALTSLEVPFTEWNGHLHEDILVGDRWAYLVNYSSAAEGWNCITTDTIIFYSDNYSYKIMTQAAGRINRLNTPYDHLYYYHLVSDSPIDRSIRNTLIRKKKFNEATFLKKQNIHFG